MSPIQTINEPFWMAVARKYEGLKEIPGPRHNKVIVEWMKEFSNGAIIDDETAWCGAYTGAVLEEAGLPVPANPLSARSYLSLPVKLDRPAVGAIAVFWRGSPTGWQGHVGLIGGKDQNGRLMIISGNADNQVKWAPYQWQGKGHRLLGIVWPSKYPLESRFNLPLMESDGKLVGSEA